MDSGSVSASHCFVYTMSHDTENGAYMQSHLRLSKLEIKRMTEPLGTPLLQYVPLHTFT